MLDIDNSMVGLMGLMAGLALVIMLVISLLEWLWEKMKRRQ